jgi:hypothetical protein
MRAPWLSTRSRNVRTAGLGVFVTLLVGATPLIGSPAQASAPTRPFYSLARTRWLSEAQMVSSAWQNIPLISAVQDLKLGLAQGGDTKGYARAIATITDFEGIPITSETTEQMTESHRDWSRLNAFFDVGKVQAATLLREVPSGALFHAARSRYDDEPAGIHDGVNAKLLKAAVADLRRESIVVKSRAILYLAGIADLTNLENASPADIAASNSTLLNPYRQDIAYLDALFETDRLEGPGGSPAG